MQLITIHRTNGKLQVQVRILTRIDKLNIRFPTIPACTDLRCLAPLRLPISTAPTIGKLRSKFHKDLNRTLARTICIPKTAVCSYTKVIFQIRYPRVKIRTTDTIKATSSSSTTTDNRMNSHAFEKTG